MLPRTVRESLRRVVNSAPLWSRQDTYAPRLPSEIAVIGSAVALSATLNFLVIHGQTPRESTRCAKIAPAGLSQKTVLPASSSTRRDPLNNRASLSATVRPLTGHNGLVEIPSIPGDTF